MATEYGRLCALVLYFFTVILMVGGSDLIVRSSFRPQGCDEMRKSKDGDKVLIHYEASVDYSTRTGSKGMVFDSSRKRDEPFDFVLGQAIAKVTQGVDKGCLDMCVGEKRVVTIPPELGFGDQGALPNIPGGATLRYEIECLNISTPTMREALLPGNVWTEIDEDENWKVTKPEMAKWFKQRKGLDFIPDDLFEKDDKNKVSCFLRKVPKFEKRHLIHHNLFVVLFSTSNPTINPNPGWFCYLG